MLQTLKIRGFQKHKKLDLELDAEITCLTGVNDTGKTAVLRAIQWLLFNEPLGTDFINWDMDFCKVTAVIDGRTLTRYRSANKNYYKLDGDTYKALRSGVPPDIERFLNVGQVNIQNQRDRVFLLSESAGQIGRSLNAVIDLDVMDNFLACVASEIRGYSAEEKVVRARIEEASSKQKELQWVHEMNEDLLTIERLQQELEVEKETNLVLRQAVAEYSKYKKMVEATIPMIEITELQEKRSNILLNLFGLDVYLKKYKEAEELANMEVPDLRGWDTLLAEKEKIRSQLWSVKNCISDLMNEEENEKYWKAVLVNEVKRLREAVKGKCPVCNNEWEP